eukprot:SAG11_NODE_29495_length_310_cov_0.890995_1_plen_93_part_01
MLYDQARSEACVHFCTNPNPVRLIIMLVSYQACFVAHSHPGRPDEKECQTQHAHLGLNTHTGGEKERKKENMLSPPVAVVLTLVLLVRLNLVH